MKPILRHFFGVLIAMFAVLAGGCNSGGKSSAMNSTNVQSLVLYDLDPRKVSNYSDLLTKVSSHSLKPEEVQLLFANTKEESLHIWKGALLGVLQCKDGTKYHLAISNFGGFVRVLETGQSIRFVGASGTEWERIQSAVLRDVFIPARQRRNQGEER
ncbi:MAG: hypothetical protein M1608_04865 [Candidatus Omnitrophica bacterium]|nr:hypothetical protein [Candidatus Omnitrophota bacterium]